MHRVSALWLGTNFGVRSPTDDSFYLWLTVKKMGAFSVFTEIYLRSCNCSGTNFTVEVNCMNKETEIQSQIIEIQFI